MDGHEDNAKQSTADMTAFVQNLLEQMYPQDFLNFMPLDEMGTRIEELEQSINDLRAEMGVEGSPSPSAPQPKEKESE